MSKIVLIHSQAGIDWKSNSAVFAVELARRLDNYFEVELLCGAECGSFSRPLNFLPRASAGFVSSASRLSRGWFQRSQVAIEPVASFLPCVSYLLNHPADLILPQDGYSSLLAAACVRKLRKTPILFTEHCGLSNRGRSLKRNLTLRPDRLIAPNPAVAKAARWLAPAQTIDTIPFGVDPTEFTPTGEPMQTGLSKPCAIAVETLDRQSDRRVELVIEAVARVPNLSLLICGEGADRSYYQELGERLLGRSRFQIRSFAYAQMPQVYRSVSVFTSAATKEFCGLKYIEAMACGLPVVATDDTVRRYLIGRGGKTCDVSDLDAYSSCLQSAIVKHWYQQQPRQNALKFSWQGVTLLYYQAVLKTMNTSASLRQFVPSGNNLHLLK